MLNFKFILIAFLFALHISVAKDNFNAKPILIDYKGITGKDSTIIAFGNYGSCLISYDGDKTWEYKRIFDKGIINQMFIEDERIVAFTSDGQIAVSYDNAKTWEQKPQIDIMSLENDKYNYTYILSTKNGYIIRKRKNLYFFNKNFHIIKTLEYPLSDKLFLYYETIEQLKPIIYDENKILILNYNNIIIYNDNFDLIEDISIKDKFLLQCDECLIYSDIFADSSYYYLKIWVQLNSINYFKISKDFSKINEIISKESIKNSMYGVINNKLLFNASPDWFEYDIPNNYDSLDVYFNNRKFIDRLSRNGNSSGILKKQSYYYDKIKDKLYLTFNNNTINVVDNFSDKAQHNFRVISSGGYFNLTNIRLFKIYDELMIAEQNGGTYGIITSFFDKNSNIFRNKFEFDLVKKADNSKLSTNRNFQFLKLREKDTSIILASRPSDSWNEFYQSKDTGRYFKLYKKYIDTAKGVVIFRNLVSNHFSFNKKLGYDFMCHGREIIKVGEAPYFASFFSLIDDEMNSVQQVSIRDEISYLAYFSDFKNVACFGTNSNTFDYSVKSTSNNGESWDTLKVYSIDLFIQEYKELEINGRIYWAISYFDGSNNVYSIDMFDLETKEIKTVFKQELTDTQSGQLQFITFDAAKEKFYLSFFNTLMVSSNIFNQTPTWETFNYPNNGRVNKKLQIFDKTIFARYEDDKNENNFYWINGIEMVGDPTSVENIEEVNYLFTMPPYPNPTVSEVTAKFYWDSRIDIDNSEIAVFDITGNKVSGKESLILEKLNEWSGNIKWNCVGQPKGTYLIKIQHGNNTKTVKVVVN